jgi:hypothetical protein
MRVRGLVVIVVVAAVAFLVSPAFDGYHLGCNTSVGDNLSVTRAGLLWCKHGVTPAEREEAMAKLAQQSKAQEEHATEERERPAREAKEAKEAKEEKAREAQEAREFDEQQRANEAKAEQEQRAQEAREPREQLESEGKAP